MAEGKRATQMEERLRILQSFQIELKEAFEHHGKLLTEILQCVQNLRTAKSLTGKTHQAEHAVIGPPLGRCSICMTSDARAQHPKFIENATTPELPLPTPYQIGSSFVVDPGVLSNVRIVNLKFNKAVAKPQLHPNPTSNV